MRTLYVATLFEDWSVANPVPSGKCLLMLVPDRTNLELEILERTVCRAQYAESIAGSWMSKHGKFSVLFDVAINQE